MSLNVVSSRIARCTATAASEANARASGSHSGANGTTTSGDRWALISSMTPMTLPAGVHSGTASSERVWYSLRWSTSRSKSGRSMWLA